MLGSNTDLCVQVMAHALTVGLICECVAHHASSGSLKLEINLCFLFSAQLQSATLQHALPTVLGSLYETGIKENEL